MADLQTTYGDGNVTTSTDLGQGAGINLPPSLGSGGGFDIGGMGGLFKAVLARRLYEADLKSKMAMQEAALRERESDLRMRQAEAEISAQRRREEEDKRRYRDAQSRLAGGQGRGGPGGPAPPSNAQRQIEERGEPIYAKMVSSMGGLMGKAGNLETTPWDLEGAFTGHYRRPGATLSGSGGGGGGYAAGGLTHGGDSGRSAVPRQIEEEDDFDTRYFKQFGRRPGTPYEELPANLGDEPEDEDENTWSGIAMATPEEYGAWR